MVMTKICPTHAIKTTGMSIRIILSYLFIETSANWQFGKKLWLPQFYGPPEYRLVKNVWLTVIEVHIVLIQIKTAPLNQIYVNLG